MNPPVTLTHPDLEDPAVLIHIADRLKREFGAQRVIVFGSVARGEATIDSDIDLLIVAPTAEKSYQRMASARAVIRNLSFGLPISPLVLTPSELQHRIEMGDSLLLEIVETGVEL